MQLIPRLDRYRRFYAGDPTCQTLIAIRSLDDYVGMSINLDSFDFAHMDEHERYWDLISQRMQDTIAFRETLDDDWVPGITLGYGFGSFGAVYCDSPLVFTERTSYMEHTLETWEEWDAVAYDPDRFWSRVFINAGHYLTAQADGAYYVDPYPNPSPMDVINLFMGNYLFEAFYTEPERLLALLERITPEVIRNYRTIQTTLKPPHDGTMAFNSWIPQGLLLLEDAADLCSPAIYNRFGRPFTERVIAACGGGYIHHHSLGRHQHGNMAAIPGLAVLQMSSDPNCRRPATDLEHILGQAANTPIEIECTPEEVYEYLPEISQGRIILKVGCQSLADANELVACVRSHSTT